MGIINVLDMSVANLIAAGEVVERPASVIKELTENAIDAGARSITAEIKRGGVSFMRITDDGCGMTAEDAVACLRRHATSKIHTAADLSGITTLGFRGEAMAAISAVTDMRIMTRLRGETAGTLVRCEYGSVSEVSEGGFPEGTTVICENLFARTPARLKFLRSDVSEGIAVSSLMEKMALSHPEIAFRYICDGEMRFSTAGDGNLKNAVYSVFGKGFASRMTEASARSGGISVSGYISTPENVRGNRNMQLFFINSRSVRSRTMTAALEAAYSSYIPQGKFPSCVLFLKIHASAVDVNVHPAKLEVKFSNEKEIFDAVYYTVRGALDAKLNRPAFDLIKKSREMTDEKLKVVSGFAPIDEKKHTQEALPDLRYAGEGKPEAKSKSETRTEPEAESFGSAASRYAANEIKPIFAPERVYADMPHNKPLHEESTFSYAEKTDAKVSAPTEFQAAKTEPKEPFGGSAKTYQTDVKQSDGFYGDTDARIGGHIANELPEYRIVGEVFESYIIMETEGKMLIIDKHAAHERINFERMRANMSLSDPYMQALLVPEVLTLSGAELDAALNFGAEISAVGFLFEISGNNMVIRAVPQDMGIADAKELLQTLVSAAADNPATLETKKRTVFERALYQTSCKAAIKAGRHYDDVHIRWICENLLRYDCIKYCPHGRPVAFELTKGEMDRRFGRT